MAADSLSIFLRRFQKVYPTSTYQHCLLRRETASLLRIIDRSFSTHFLYILGRIVLGGQASMFFSATRIQLHPSCFLQMANRLSLVPWTNPFVSGMPRLVRWSLGPSKDTQVQSGPLHFLLMANRLSLAPRTNPFVSGMLRLVRWPLAPLK